MLLKFQKKLWVEKGKWKLMNNVRLMALEGNSTELLKKYGLMNLKVK